MLLYDKEQLSVFSHKQQYNFEPTLHNLFRSKYLSFRCFSQLYQLFPLNKTQLTTIIMSYVTIFVLMFYSGSAYFVLPKIIHKNSYLLIEGFRRKLKTVGYLTSVSLLKVFVGYIHSALCHDGSSQIICLFLIQTIQLALLIMCHEIYLCKFLFTCHIIENIFRTILHLLLCLEIYSGMELSQNTNILEQIIGSFINYIFFLCIADIFISNFFGGSEESAQKKKNIVQQNKQIKHQSQSNMVILQTRRVNIIELQNQENNKDQIIEKKSFQKISKVNRQNEETFSENKQIERFACYSNSKEESPNQENEYDGLKQYLIIVLVILFRYYYQVMNSRVLRINNLSSKDSNPCNRFSYSKGKFIYQKILLETNASTQNHQLKRPL